MRFLLRSSETADTLLDKAVQSAFLVVEGSIPESRKEDIQMGLYVALRQVLNADIVRSEDCGKLPDCAALVEGPPFTIQVAQGVTNRP